jgi:hypothetical protein
MDKSLETRDVIFVANRSLLAILASGFHSAIQLMFQPFQAALQRLDMQSEPLDTPFRESNAAFDDAFGDAFDDDLLNATWEDAEWQ